MVESVQVAAFEGGKLRILSGGEDSREAVLALPLSRLIVKMVRIPAENREDPVAVATPVLQAMSPFPDEALTVSCETVRETDEGAVAIAAALPESAADDIAQALDEAKLNVTRVDALCLGELRGLWSQLGASSAEGAPPVRRLVLFRSADCISIVVLDGDGPSAIRAVSPGGDLRREVMLSLLSAEDFGGGMELAEIVAVDPPPAPAAEGAEPEAGAAEASVPQVEGDWTEGLSAFAPVRRIAVADRDDALRGVAGRSTEPGALDALPASWREMLEETRFKSKLCRALAIAGGIWALAMAVLFAVPFAYDLMADHQKSLSREHARQYRAVREMKEKVNLVRKYSDHDRGALEIMKAVSDRLPEGVELSSWNFKREEGVRVSGEADDASLVYRFKDAMVELSAGGEEEGDEGEAVFKGVNLNGPSAGKGGRQKFDLDCRYEAEEER